jgi:hypothetical protein
MRTEGELVGVKANRRGERKQRKERSGVCKMSFYRRETSARETDDPASATAKHDEKRRKRKKTTAKGKERRRGEVRL